METAVNKEAAMNNGMKIVIASGPPASGKTSVMTELIKLEEKAGVKTAACKIDCLKTEDGERYARLGIPSVCGLSEDVCPDHFLAVNLEEIAAWGARCRAEILVLETAGLCHRCAPATKKTISVCVLDCASNIAVPEKIGPALTTCDIAVISKSDMVSQAETEVFIYAIRKLNKDAEIVEVNGRTGAGAPYLKALIDQRPPTGAIAGDELRHSMPSAICSYCVGERRIGNVYQQGVVKKMDFPDV
jgi:Ni2+-binding GTPase involved in maturation of urease and hydrogenase